jgi:hypothetical protein
VRKGSLKAFPKWLVVVLALVGVVGCERDLPFVVPPPVSISGYQIEGYVTDRLGIPVKNLPIALWYEFDYVDGTPPNRTFYVDNSNATSLVRVLDIKKNVKRVLFQGRAPLGVLDVSWDQKDSLGHPVLTGIYTVEFRQGGVPKNSYTTVVNGNVAAVTDSLGHYTISNDLLPVGFYPAPLYSNDDTNFLGNFQVSSYIVLEFYLTSHRSASITLTPDQVTRLDYRI